MDTLFHYCSNSTFHSIISKNSIWLSSLNLSNDSMEGKLIRKIIAQFTEDDGMNSSDRLGLEAIIHGYERRAKGFGFCLSKEGDLLSQWRGYADDGCGFSIGFSQKYLNELQVQHDLETVRNFTLKKIIYDVQEQTDILRPSYMKIKKNIDEGAFKEMKGRGLDLTIKGAIEAWSGASQYTELHNGIVSLYSEFFTFKKSAFKEEKEWRLVTIMDPASLRNCDFRPTENKLVPYKHIDLIGSESSVFDKIFLGPKNQTPIHVVKSFFEKFGHYDVEVARSEASYQ